MTKIIDLPTAASTDANTFVPVYKNGKTQKVSATVFGGGGSGLDLTSTTDVPAVEGTEYLPLNKPLGTVFKVTIQRILDWILARANTWTGNQTFNSDIGVASLNGGQLAGLRNKIINGSFRVNQRGYVSGTATTAGQYTLDRWKVTGTGGVTFSTTSNKTTVTIPSGQTIQQVIEGSNLETGTYILSWEGTAQGRIGSGSYGASGAVTASITGGVNTTIEFNTGTVSLVMFEKSSKPTPFEQIPVALELILCQRYYYRVKPGVGQPFAFGVNYSTTLARFALSFPVTMRIAPTALEQSGSANNYVVSQSGIGNTVLSVVPVFGVTTREMATFSGQVASGLTQFNPSTLSADTTNGANAYLGWSAEL